MKSQLIEKWSISAVVNSLFVFEAVRKFAIGSQNVLIAYEILCAALAFALITRAINRRILEIMAILGALFLWGLLSTINSKFDISLIFIGLRPYIASIAALVFGVRIIQIMGAEKFEQAAFRVVLFWIFTITLVAVMQIYLGPSHFLTVGVGRDEAMGLGTWGEGSDLFRTTSIFQHTGKYGQIIFLLCSFSAYLRAQIKPNYHIGIAVMALELAAVIISGQRAGSILFLLLIFTIYASTLRRIFLTGLAFTAASIFGAGLLSLVSGIAQRTMSAIDEIPIRIHMNIILPLSDAMGNYPITGIGFGSLSFGSQAFGGDLLTSFIKVGNAENSYARIIVEIGFIGLVFVCIFFAHILFTALTKKIDTSDHQKNTRNFSICLTLAIIVWGNTHDTLGATATTGILFFLISPIYVKSSTIAGAA